MPSPGATCPRAVSHAARTTASTERCRSAISHASRRPSTAAPPDGSPASWRYEVHRAGVVEQAMRGDVQDGRIACRLTQRALGCRAPQQDPAPIVAVEPGQCADLAARIGQGAPGRHGHVVGRSVLLRGCLPGVTKRQEPRQPAGAMRAVRMEPLEDADRRSARHGRLLDQVVAGRGAKGLERQLPERAVRHDDEVRLAFQIGVGDPQHRVVDVASGLAEVEVAVLELAAEPLDERRQALSAELQPECSDVDAGRCAVGVRAVEHEQVRRRPPPPGIRGWRCDDRRAGPPRPRPIRRASHRVAVAFRGARRSRAARNSWWARRVARRNPPRAAPRRRWAAATTSQPTASIAASRGGSSMARS